jgi:hypothetical protein
MTSDSSSLRTTAPSKRQRIKEFLETGKYYSARQVARAVGTSPGNVWKEKSNFKADGFRSRSKRKTEEAIHSRDEMILIPEDARRRAKPDAYSYSHHYRFLNIPELDEQGLKILYTEFKDGKKPAEIISQHGFHPEVVEEESKRFFRLNQQDIIGSFQNQIVESLSCIENTSLTEKLTKEGHLSVNEFIELIELRLERNIELGKKIQAKLDKGNKG